MKRTALLSATILLLTASCVKEQSIEQIPDVPAGPLTISAGSSSICKTILSGGDKILWLNTDLLYVFNRENTATLFSTTDDDVQSASFSTPEWPGGTPTYAVHLNPDYNEQFELECPVDGVLPVKFRPVQNVIWKGTFARQASASVGKVEYVDNRFVIKEMKNVMSVLSFRIEGDNVEKIVARSIGNEVMAGWVNVDYAKLEAGETDFWAPIEGKKQSSTVTLTPGGNIVKDSCFQPGTYYMTLLPQNYKSGIEFSIYTGGSATPLVRTIGKNGGVVLKRSEIRTVSTGVDDLLPANITIDLPFYNDGDVNPLGFGDLSASDESAGGETYSYTFNYEIEGSPASMEFPIVVCKGSSAGARYHYKSYSLVWPEGRTGSLLAFDQANGWIIAPAIKGRVLKSILYEHGNAYTKQMVVKEITDPSNPRLGDAVTIAYTSKQTPVASADGPSSDRISFYSNGFESTNVTANTKPGVPYFLQFTGNNGTRVYRIKLEYGTSLPEIPNFSPEETDFPRVIVTTNDGQAIVDKETKIRGYLQYDNVGGVYPEPMAVADSMVIKGRGNTTWTKHPKKPYKVKLDSKSSFFGIDKDKEWVLLANHSDKSLLRNLVAMKISSILGFDWTPGMRPVELWLNGRYEGAYCLAEHKKVSKSRININLPEDGGNDMYLEFDQLMDETTCFKTDRFGIPVMFSDPEVPSDEMLSETKKWFEDFEAVLESGSFADPETGYPAYIDVPSFINHYIIQELSKNVDGRMNKGAFVTRTTGGPMKIYHEWDFDIAFGNDYAITSLPGVDAGPTGFLIKDFTGSQKGTGWYPTLFRDPVFVEAVKQRWNEVYPRLREIPDYIDSMASFVRPAAERNFRRWPILGKYVWPNVKWPATYDEEVACLKEFYSSRLEWLNENLAAL